MAGFHHDLDLLFAQLSALHDLAADPDHARDSDRVYDFSIRWGALLHGRLQRLDYYSDRGELAADERERYDELQRALRDAIPAIDRLGLVRPEHLPS